MFNKIKILLLLLVMMKPPVSSATDPLSSGVEKGVASAVAVELLGITGTLDDIMEQAANQANFVVFHAAAQVKMTIESLRISAKDVIDHSTERLDDSQYQLFMEIKSTVQLLEVALDQPVEQARQTVENVHQIISDVKFDDTPAILRSSPSVIGPRQFKEIVFTFRGLNIDKAAPKLKFNEIEARQLTLEKQIVQFSIDRSIFSPSKNSEKVITGSLSLVSEECKFWFLICDEIENEFPVSVLVLPEQLGTVDIKYDTKSEERIYSDRKFARRFSKATGDLLREHCETFNQGAHAGNFFIDIDSIKPESYQVPCDLPEGGDDMIGKLLRKLKEKACPNGLRTYAGVHGEGSHNWKFMLKETTGFSVKLCAQAQMHTLTDKDDGLMRVNLVWKEYEVDELVSPRTSLSKEELYWGSPLEFKLPDETHGVLVKVEYFDGTSIITSGSKNDSYLDISWNNATKQLIVSPREPSVIEEIY